MAAPQAPGDLIAAARANATRPCMGRVVLKTWRDFTMGSLKNWALDVSGLGYDGADCK
jgi:hypothetical protein